MRTRQQKTLAGLALFLGGYLLFLLVPCPLTETHPAKWLRETRGKIRTADIRKYCTDQLGVSYNYSRDVHRPELEDDYYAKMNYIANHLYINDDYKFIYLAIPKVACSNWKKLLLQLKNVTDEKKLSWPHNFGDHRRLSNVPREEWRAVLQDYGYFKFAFVRNPWTRLVSAYVDRFTRHDKWWYSFIQKTEGRRMIKNYRVGASEAEVEDASDVRFSEFVQDIIEHRKKAPNGEVATNLNEHWNAEFYIAGLCHPWVEFDMIARYEDLDTDAATIFKRLGLPETLAAFPKPSRNSSTLKRAAVEYALLDSDLLADLTRQMLPDMQMLGYNVPTEVSHIIDVSH